MEDVQPIGDFSIIQFIREVMRGDEFFCSLAKGSGKASAAGRLSTCPLPTTAWGIFVDFGPKLLLDRFCFVLFPWITNHIAHLSMDLS